jgi:hypothetical protein
MLHAAMTYMRFAPEWWYVTDDERSFGFALLVVFLDSFPMSTLFFMAGYFAPPSFRRGASFFIYDKFVRIGIPWIIGVALISPFFAYASFTKYGLEASIPDFITKWFFGPFYMQGHYWFLGVLFFFFAVYAAAARKMGKRGLGGKGPAAVPIVVLWFLSTAGYYLAASFIKPAAEWVNIGYILYFQHARFVGYAGIFALGIYGWNSGWFQPGGWSPNTIFWGVAGVGSSALLLWRQFFLAPALNSQTRINLLLEAICYNLTMITMTFFLIAVFTRKNEPRRNAVQILAPHSYSIYWTHQIILMPFVYFLKPFDVNIFIKWAVACLFTVTVGAALSFVTKRTPLPRRIF